MGELCTARHSPAELRRALFGYSRAGRSPGNGAPMTIDTLAYAKELEAAGVERRAAEAHAEALTHPVMPDLITKADLQRAVERLEQRVDQAVDRVENRLKTAIEQTAHQQTVRFFGLTFGIVGLMNAILFALLRSVH